jgi:hypothetical protein
MDQIKKAKAAGMSEDDQKIWSDEVQDLTDKAIAWSTRRWRPSRRKSCRSEGGRTGGKGRGSGVQDRADMTCPAAPAVDHVAIIMDGNGRWAQKRGWPRLFGHARGRKRVKEIVRACPDLGSST